MDNEPLSLDRSVLFECPVNGQPRLKQKKKKKKSSDVDRVSSGRSTLRFLRASLYTREAARLARISIVRAIVYSYTLRFGNADRY